MKPRGRVALLAGGTLVDRLLLRRQLEHLGWMVTTTDDAEAAVYLVVTDEPAVVLVGEAADGLLAADVVRRIRVEELTRDEPTAVLAFTGEGPAARDRLLGAGADDVLDVPLPAAELEAALVRWTAVGCDVDVEVLSSLADELGAADALVQVVEAYIAQLPLRTKAIEHGIEEGDERAVTVAAHSLASASALVGVHGVAAAARRLERDPTSAQTAGSVLALLDRIPALLGDALERVLYAQPLR